MKQSRIHCIILAWLLFAFACSELLIEDPVVEDFRMEDFEEAWNVVDEWYPYFDFKQINWDSIYTIYYVRMEEANSSNYLLLINQMLLELKDGHVATILENGQNLTTYRTPRQIKDENSFDITLTQTYLTTDLHSIEEDRIQYGLIGNIGYFRLATLVNGDWVSSIDDVFDELKDTEALILDIRHNGGGSTFVAQKVVEKSIQESLNTPGWREKGIEYNGPVFEPDMNNNYAKPMVILANGKSFSSSEHFVMWMQHIDHVIFVGDTTGGGSGNPLLFPLPSGNEIKVSTRYFYRYDGAPIEWNGIVPDHLVPQTEVDIQNGQDLQLEYAIECLSF